MTAKAMTCAAAGCMTHARTRGPCSTHFNSTEPVEPLPFEHHAAAHAIGVMDAREGRPPRRLPDDPRPTTAAYFTGYERQGQA